MMKLSGKVALVSGVGRGIGRAVALKLAREGASLVINDLDEAPAAATLAAMEGLGSPAETCLGNVTEPDFADRFVAAALDRFGGIDIIATTRATPGTGSSTGRPTSSGPLCSTCI